MKWPHRKPLPRRPEKIQLSQLTFECDRNDQWLWCVRFVWFSLTTKKNKPMLSCRSVNRLVGCSIGLDIARWAITRGDMNSETWNSASSSSLVKSSIVIIIVSHLAITVSRNRHCLNRIRHPTFKQMLYYWPIFRSREEEDDDENNDTDNDEPHSTQLIHTHRTLICFVVDGVWRRDCWVGCQ